MSKAPTMKLTEAQKLLDQYTKILRIEDWDITLTILSDAEYQKQHGKDFSFDTNGCTEIDEVNSTAKIYMKESLPIDEFKTTLLHECVHLVTHRYDSFVRKVISLIDSKKIKKQLTNESLWEMEIGVSKVTTILHRLLN